MDILHAIFDGLSLFVSGSLIYTVLIWLNHH